MGTYSLTNKINRKELLDGVCDGIPIALGYFAVAFSLGITARNIGIKPLQAMVTSLLVHASAGEYAGYKMVEGDVAYIEMALMILIANARYLLMSCSLSQHLNPSLGFLHRLFIGFGITDELFGISIARPNHLNPNYMYGGMLIAIPSWALGSAIGCFSGSVLPNNIVSALSVALYGMFLAIIIPPAKSDHVIGILIIISFVASFLTSRMNIFASVSTGTVTIILTVVISSLAAIIVPHDDDATDESDTAN